MDITRKYIAPYCFQLVATDIIKRFDDTNIPKNVIFQIEDTLNLSFPDNTFDGVISIGI